MSMALAHTIEQQEFLKLSRRLSSAELPGVSELNADGDVAVAHCLLGIWFALFCFRRLFSG
jgi:hypothetical protein